MTSVNIAEAMEVKLAASFEKKNKKTGKPLIILACLKESYTGKKRNRTL